MKESAEINMQFYNYLVIHNFAKLHAKFYNKMFIGKKLQSPFLKRHHSILDAMQFNFLVYKFRSVVRARNTTYLKPNNLRN